MRSDQITRIDIGLGHKLSDLDGRVESSAMSTANGTFRQLLRTAKEISHCFREKLSSFDDCSPSTSIAIVPSSEGWTAVMTHRDRTEHPNCVRRIEQLQKQLREIYVLAKD